MTLELADFGDAPQGETCLAACGGPDLLMAPSLPEPLRGKRVLGCNLVYGLLVSEVRQATATG